MWRTHLVIFLLVAMFLTTGVSRAFAEGQALSFGQENPGPTRNEAVLKSLLWPGLGQISQGRTLRGSVWAGGAVTLIAGTFFTHMQYNSTAVEYEGAVASLRRALAEDNADAAYAYYLQLDELHARADDRKGYRTSMEIGLVLWWAGSLVDTWLFERGDDPRGSSGLALLPGRLEPVLRHDAPGLVWSLDF